MRVPVGMAVIYGGCGMASALRINSHGLLDTKLALIALFLLCAGHLCWRAAKRRHRTNHARPRLPRQHEKPAPFPLEPLPGEDLI